jgi:hypothetical protein
MTPADDPPKKPEIPKQAPPPEQQDRPPEIDLPPHQLPADQPLKARFRR